MATSITRRKFLSYLLSTGALTGLSSAGLLKLESWAADSDPDIVWLEGSGCSGCLISLANYFDSEAQMGFPEVITSINLEYLPLLMTASGEPAFSQLLDIIDRRDKHIVLLVSGAIPNRSGFCSLGSVGGREYETKEMLVELTRKAIMVIGIGSCAAYGGIASTRSQLGPRFAPLEHYLPPATPLVLLPGCPSHPDWIVSTLAKVIAGESIALDRYKRPLSFFEQTVCSQCPRLPQKRAGKFARDIGSKALCLQPVGCKGEVSFCDAGTRGWNESDSWCVAVNTICIGCTEPFFPDAPFMRVEST